MQAAARSNRSCAARTSSRSTLARFDRRRNPSAGTVTLMTLVTLNETGRVEANTTCRCAREERVFLQLAQTGWRSTTTTSLTGHQYHGNRSARTMTLMALVLAASIETGRAEAKTICRWPRQAEFVFQTGLSLRRCRPKINTMQTGQSEHHHQRKACVGLKPVEMKQTQHAGVPKKQKSSRTQVSVRGQG